MGATSLKARFSFGLVSFDTRVYPALEPKEKAISFKTLHAKCGTPVTMPKWCPKCEAPADELVSGWPHEGSFVQVSADERASVAADRSPAIDVHKFIPPFEENEWWLAMRHAIAATYYLVPDPALPMNLERYTLVHEALQATGLLGLTKVSLWSSRAWTCVIEADEQGLTLSKLHPIRALRDRPALTQRSYNAQHLELAKQLIETLTASPTLDDFEHASDVELRKLIEAKIEGGSYSAPTVGSHAPPEGDILDVLRASIKAAEAHEAASNGKSKAKAPKKAKA